MYKPIAELIYLIKELDENAKPLWGKMTPQKMVEHLLRTFQISNGKLEAKLYLDENKLPVLKKILMSDRPMPKNFDSPANPNEDEECQYENFETAKMELLKEVIQYYNYFDENPDKKLTNPTFGKLSKSEWDQFHRKHLTHHFTQFGLIK